MLLVKRHPSLFIRPERTRGLSVPIARALPGLFPVQAFEFLCFLDRQANQNPPTNCINKISSGRRVAWSNHVATCVKYQSYYWLLREAT
jgi:hypothetical protein